MEERSDRACGYEFNYKLHAIQVESHTGSLPREHSYVSVTPENVVLTAVKKAEDDNGLIFRVFEWAGKQSDVSLHRYPRARPSATETNLMEKPIGSPLTVTGDKVTSPSTPTKFCPFAWTTRMQHGGEQSK